MKSALRRRTFLQRLAAAGGATALGCAGPLPRVLAEHPQVRRQRWRIGHHFWNWDHAWNKAEFFERRLQLTRETGYAGFEAKPGEIGHAPEFVREKCAEAGIACVAILREICEFDHTLIRSFACTLTGVASPGETLVAELWQDANVVSCRLRVPGRDAVVLDEGRCILAA